MAQKRRLKLILVHFIYNYDIRGVQCGLSLELPFEVTV